MIIAPKKAAELVREGGIIVYPTETVYGIGGDPFNENVVRRIYRIKNRPPEKSYLLLVNEKIVVHLVEEVTPLASLLIKNFWPGPLTIIFKTSRKYRNILGEKVALRISPHPVVRGILRYLNSPLISTSANISGAPPITDFEDVKRQFEKVVDGIVEGECGGEKPSTIIDAYSGNIVREGSISKEEIISFLERS